MVTKNYNQLHFSVTNYYNQLCARPYFRSKLIVDQTDSGDSAKPITAFPLKEMKSLGAKEMEKAVDHIISNPFIITNGFQAAGIVNR